MATENASMRLMMVIFSIKPLSFLISSCSGVTVSSSAAESVVGGAWIQKRNASFLECRVTGDCHSQNSCNQSIQ